jgi:hypothetical protein
MFSSSPRNPYRKKDSSLQMQIGGALVMFAILLITLNEAGVLGSSSHQISNKEVTPLADDLTETTRLMETTAQNAMLTEELSAAKSNHGREAAQLKKELQKAKRHSVAPDAVSRVAIENERLKRELREVRIELQDARHSAANLLKQHPAHEQEQHSAPKTIEESAVGTDIDEEEQAPRLLPDEDIHIVFSTDCRNYQGWQSEALAYSLLKLDFKGKVTRIVSGCDDTTDFAALRRSTNPRYGIHVTPSFNDLISRGGKWFPFYNKPFGVQDWLKNAVPAVSETVIMIVDPDQVFLKPVSANGSVKKSAEKEMLKQLGVLSEWRDFTDQATEGHPVGKKITRTS